MPLDRLLLRFSRTKSPRLIFFLLDGDAERLFFLSFTLWMSFALSDDFVDRCGEVAVIGEQALPLAPFFLF